MTDYFEENIIRLNGENEYQNPTTASGTLENFRNHKIEYVIFRRGKIYEHLNAESTGPGDIKELNILGLKGKKMSSTQEDHTRLLNTDCSHTKVFGRFTMMARELLQKLLIRDPSLSSPRSSLLGSQKIKKSNSRRLISCI